MARFLFSSHDGFGLGHVRRNWLIATAVRQADPGSEAAIVTGVHADPTWLGGPGISVVRVPPLVKTSREGYRGLTLPFHEAVRARGDRFNRMVAEWRPDVVVVDRHPYGVAGELRPGLEQASRQGARLVLGLRDVLDEPEVVRRELVAGDGWDGAGDLYDEILVYGSAAFCDHRAEYGIPGEPRYCGWVVEPVPDAPVDLGLLVVAGGGGGDGSEVFSLGLSVLEAAEGWRGVITAGPYADVGELRDLVAGSPAGGRVTVRTNVPGCGAWFSHAGAVLEMAGYNSTLEALRAGCRPLLLPRRHPRQEQLIRSTRLAALGLAAVVAPGTDPVGLAGRLGQSPRLAPGEAEAAGITFDGARRAAAVLTGLAQQVRGGVGGQAG